MKTNIFTGMICVAVCLLSHMGRGEGEFIWGGGVGDWIDAGLWGGVVPSESVDDVWIDGEEEVDSVVTLNLTNLSHTVGCIRVDEGDCLTFRGKNSGSDSSYTGISMGALCNSGVVTLLGGSSSKKHGNTFDVSIRGPETNAVFNTSTGVIEYQGLSNYRRGHSFFTLPGEAINEGVVKVIARNSQSGGYANMRLYTSGKKDLCYTNDGETWLVGKGGGDVWCCLTTANTNGVFTLAGTGTVYLASGFTDPKSVAIVGTTINGVTIINTVEHSIVGSGYVGHSGANTSSSQARISLSSPKSVVNEGLIRAERLEMDEKVSSVSLLVLGSGGCVVSNALGGRIVSGSAEAPCDLQLGGMSGAGVFWNEGVLEVREGNVCSFGSNMVVRLEGELRGGGTFRKGLEDAPEAVLEVGARVYPGDGVGRMKFRTSVEFVEGTEWELDLTDVEDCDGVDVLGACTVRGVIRVAEGSEPEGKTFRVLTCAPGGLVDGGVILERYGDAQRGYLEWDEVEGTLDVIFPAARTLIFVR